MQLDHVTIKTRDLPTAREFFMDVFSLEERARPDAIRHIPGHWLYSENEPLVHLIGSHANNTDQTSESIDHVGFRLAGYAAFRQKLDRLGIPYSPMELPELNERRLFFRTPGGPVLEAAFRLSTGGAVTSLPC